MNGIDYRFVIYLVNQDGIDLLEQWISSLDTPYLRDIVLEDVVYTYGAEYIEGRKDIDETMQAIIQSVEIYLYE